MFLYGFSGIVAGILEIVIPRKVPFVHAKVILSWFVWDPKVLDTDVSGIFWLHYCPEQEII